MRPEVVWQPLRRRPWTWARRFVALGLAAAFALRTVLPAGTLEGNWAAARWFGVVRFTDPLAFLETAAASRSLPWALLSGLVLTAGLAVLLGRIFCGWFCPLGLVLELVGAVRAKVGSRAGYLRGLATTARPSWRRTKYAILAACLLASLVAGIPVFTAYSPINMPFVADGTWLPAAFAPLAILMLLEWRWPHLFCRCLCPLGALYSILGRFGWLHIRIKPSTACARCRYCSVHCPMGIAVMENHVLEGHRRVASGECTRCGACTEGCLGGVLSLRIGPPHREAGTENTPGGA